MTESWEADTVLMPVPLRLAEQVGRFVSDLKAGCTYDVVATTPPAAELGGARGAGSGTWTEAMVEELADAMPCT